MNIISLMDALFPIFQVIVYICPILIVLHVCSNGRFWNIFVIDKWFIELYVNRNEIRPYKVKINEGSLYHVMLIINNSAYHISLKQQDKLTYDIEEIYFIKDLNSIKGKKGHEWGYDGFILEGSLSIFNKPIHMLFKNYFNKIICNELWLFYNKGPEFYTRYKKLQEIA